MKFINLLLLGVILSSFASTAQTTSSGSLTFEATTDLVLKYQSVARSIPASGGSNRGTITAA